MKFNINDYIKVKINDLGNDILREQHDEIKHHLPSEHQEYTPKKADKDGYTEFQLGDVMESFGGHVGLGRENPFDLTIDIPGVRNTLVYSKPELDKFLAKFPTLEKDEVIFLALFQRNKHLTSEQRKEMGLPRCNVIARAICREKESVFKQLKRWETDPKAFLSKTGEPIPNECLVPYITVQPISTVKGYVEFNRIITEYLVELSSNGNRTNTYDRLKKIDTLLLDCMQHAYSRKVFIDIDFDIPEKGWKTLKAFETELAEKGVKFVKVETNGGFHYLLETASIKYNYHETLAGMEDAATQYFGNPEIPGSQKKAWEIAISDNQAIPVPGCTQYDSFEVKVV